MGQTGNSSATSYLTVDEFLAREDNRTLGQLALDNGTQATPTQLETNARILACLNDASGYVEAFLLASERYTAQDLAATNGVSQQFLKRLVNNIAMYYMFMARDAPDPPKTVQDQYAFAIDCLEKLSNGQLVLAFQETEEAGVASDEFLNIGQLINLNLFSNNCQRTIGIRNAFRRNSF